MLVLSGSALALIPTDTRAQRRVDVYKAKFRVAEELLPAVQAVMTDRGSADLDRGTNSLVLIGEPRAIAEALELLTILDRKLQTVVLRYETKGRRELEMRGFDVRWTTRAGDFRIGNLVWPGRASAARAPTSSSSDASAALRAEDAIQEFTDTFTGTLRMTEGSRSRIETGTSVPFRTTGPRGSNTEFVDATTGFDASARILGDGRVQVDLQSFANRLAVQAGRRGRDARIETANAATLVTLSPGETLVVGGLDQSRVESHQSALGGSSFTTTQDDTILLLRAHIE